MKLDSATFLISLFSLTLLISPPASLRNKLAATGSGLAVNSDDVTHPLLRPAERLVIGHRGNAMHAPENTLVSMRQAIESGADALELDVHVTSDGEVVVIHDASVDRTTSGSGLVAAMSLDEIASLDAGARFSADSGATHPYRNQRIRVPTLREVLREFPGIPLVVEIKVAAAQKAVLGLIGDEKASDRVVLASFDRNAVQELRAAGYFTGAAQPELVSMFLRGSAHMPRRKADFQAAFVPRRYMGLPLSITPILRAATAAGITVHTWVENDAGTALRLWKAGVTGIVTDDPASLVRARKAG